LVGANVPERLFIEDCEIEIESKHVYEIQGDDALYNVFEMLSYSGKKGVPDGGRR